jgi:17beta-estradiol 17-dehydrogenase / very-long-chain 3-oxoacyl-CoA reductase
LIKLEKVAKNIQEEYNVNTLIIDVDFSTGYEIYDKIRKKLEGIEVGVIVNNVGICYKEPDYFLSLPDRDNLIKDMIQVNISSLPMMCSIILPQMVQRKRGLIINVSSILSYYPAATYTIYSASKAFVRKFSEDLAAEYESHGIIIQTLNPGGVRTKITGFYF